MLNCTKFSSTKQVIDLNPMKKIIYNFLIILLLSSCGSLKRKTVKEVSQRLDSKFFDNQFTGFFAIDAKTKDTLFNYNGDNYFTPASNTKIFTLFASTTFLPQKLPTLKYLATNDTLFVQGTGDPTLLHPYFKDSTAINFMKQHKHIAFYPANFQEAKFGPGWSWDDYQWYYSPERSALPLYGNVVTLHNQATLSVYPQILKDEVIPINYRINREPDKNVFYFNTSRKDTLEVPFIVDTTLTKAMLEDALGKKVVLANKLPKGEQKILYSVASDSVYKRMMQESDNFLAEQLLLAASSVFSDTLNGQKVRDSILQNELSDLAQQPRWVDGSGLSRYNLFSPQSMVHVLYKLHGSIPTERLYTLFPAGGVSGTLEDWYPGNPEPYLYAKTGSLSNNHCVSGYLLTKSGSTIIFSFMNNHFLRPTSEIKKRMQHIFEMIRDTY